MTILKIPENGISRYRATFNPATGEHIQYVLTGRETAGSVTRFRWVDEPGGKSHLIHTLAAVRHSQFSTGKQY